MDYHLVLPDFKIINLQFLLTADNGVSCLVTLGDFQKRPQGKKIWFDQSMLDIQRDSKVPLLSISLFDFLFPPSSFPSFPTNFIFIAGFAIYAFMCLNYTVTCLPCGLNLTSIFIIRSGVTTTLSTNFVCLLLVETNPSEWTRASDNIKVDTQITISIAEDPIQNRDQKKFCHLLYRFVRETRIFIRAFFFRATVTALSKLPQCHF